MAGRSGTKIPMKGGSKISVNQFSTFINLCNTILKVGITRRSNKKSTMKSTKRILADDFTLVIEMKENLLCRNKTSFSGLCVEFNSTKRISFNRQFPLLEDLSEIKGSDRIS